MERPDEAQRQTQKRPKNTKMHSTQRNYSQKTGSNQEHDTRTREPNNTNLLLNSTRINQNEQHDRYGDRRSPRDPIPLPPMIPGGLGDICTAMAAVAGIGAALTARGITGAGQIVDTSLLRTGLWANTFDLTMTQAIGRSVHWLYTVSVCFVASVGCVRSRNDSSDWQCRAVACVGHGAATTSVT
jgi:hypothetical protein